MNQTNSNTKIVSLIVLFIPSLNLFWKVISLFGEQKQIYVVFQFMFATGYSMLSIFLTNDNVYFERFWERHQKLKSFFVKVQHISILFLILIQTLAQTLPTIFEIGSDSNKERSQYLECAKKNIKKFDEMRFGTKMMFPVGTISIIMILFIRFNVFSETVICWIQEILNTGVSIVGMLFVIINAKEAQRKKV